MHQHNQTDEIVKKILRQIAQKNKMTFKKIKSLFISGDPNISKQFSLALYAQYKHRYVNVSHCPQCDKFNLEQRFGFWKTLARILNF